MMNSARLILLLLTMLMGFDVQAANIDVTVDRSQVSLNESFQITFIADEAPDGAPDFLPLEKDFEILGRSQSSSTSIINGQYSKTQQWKLSVIAKQAGKLKIPEISFGKDRSRAITLIVSEQSSNAAPAGDDELFLEVEVSNVNPYVQSQVLYMLRFYRRVSITQARLSEPELPNAVIEKLGEDSNYTTQIGGAGYQVTERKYAIFPQQSGTMTIAPLQLDAEVVMVGQPRFNGFFNRQSTQLKRIASKAITLNVQTIPETFTGSHWLAADGLSLSQEWSGDVSHMKVGEPVTRTLRIAASGTTVGQLPELHKAFSDADLKAYLDQPVLNEEKKPDGLMAVREEKIAIIPGKAGQYKLPAIEIPWFNIRTGRNEIAKIPETIVIAEGAVTTTDISPGVTSDESVVRPIVPQIAIAPAQQHNYWMWAALFFASGWLATGLYFGLRRTEETDENQQDPVQTSLRHYQKALKKACDENDPQAAKDALLGWGRSKYNAVSLGELANHCEARLRDEIKLLNACLYSANRQEDWQGKKLFQTFSEHKAREQFNNKPSDSELEPLYRL